MRTARRLLATPVASAACLLALALCVAPAVAQVEFESFDPAPEIATPMPTAITDDPGPFSKLDWQSPPQRTRTVDTGIVDQGYLDLAYPGSTLGLFNSGHPIAVWIGDRSARAGDVLLRYFTRSRR